MSTLSVTQVLLGYQNGHPMLRDAKRYHVDTTSHTTLHLPLSFVCGWMPVYDERTSTEVYDRVTCEWWTPRSDLRPPPTWGGGVILRQDSQLHTSVPL